MEKQRLVEYLEDVGFDRYLEQQMKVRLIIKNNFIAGLAKGFGAAVGATILLGILLWIVHFFSSQF